MTSRVGHAAMHIRVWHYAFKLALLFAVSPSQTEKCLQILSTMAVHIFPSRFRLGLLLFNTHLCTGMAVPFITLGFSLAIHEVVARPMYSAASEVMPLAL